jgi:hypothetical protein
MTTNFKVLHNLILGHGMNNDQIAQAQDLIDGMNTRLKHLRQENNKVREVIVRCR